METELKPLGLKTDMMSRLAQNWTIKIDRNGEMVNELLENLTVAEMMYVWGNEFKDDENEDSLKFAMLWYALDKLKAHQEFLEVEGYVRV